MHGYANKNHDFLFKNKEDKAEKLDQLICNMRCHVPRSEVNRFVKYVYDCDRDYSSYVKLDYYINLLTCKEEQQNNKENINTIKNIDIVKNIEQLDDGIYIIETVDGVIKFKSATKLLDREEDIIGKEAKKYVNDMSCKKTRQNRCHWLSVKASKILENIYNIKNEVVTGYVFYNTEKSEYLHSWIEFEKNGKQWVLDSTKNVIMNKEGYYLLMHTKEECVISKIDAKTIQEDIEKYPQILPFRPENYFYFDEEDEIIDEKTSIDIKTYLTSRDELIKDIEKNFNKMNKGEER